MKKDSKQRLFEVTARLDKTFKAKLNEEMGYSNEPRIIKAESPRPLNVIAREIYKDWRPVHPYAKEYLAAMSTLSSIDDKYMFDSGREIVARFLSNASQWKGENAKRIKTELKKMLGLRENTTLNETGEWVGDEDDMAWMEALKSEVQRIEAETNGKVKLLDVRGFDKYQGPYAITEINGRRYKIWTSSGFSFDGDNNNLLWIENYPIDNTSSEDMNAGFMGTSNAIVDMLNNDTKQNEADGIQFGVDSMPQPMNENKSQKRLFEVMGRLDKTFKPKKILKESINDNTWSVEKEYELPENQIRFTIEGSVHSTEGEPSMGNNTALGDWDVEWYDLKEGSYDEEYIDIIKEWMVANAQTIKDDLEQAALDKSGDYGDYLQGQEDEYNSLSRDPMK